MTPPSATAVTALLFSVFAFISAAICPATTAAVPAVVASYVASEDDQIMLVTNSGKLIRIRVHAGEGDSIRVAGRKTQGVRLFDVDDEEKVVSVALLNETDDDQEAEEDSQETNIENKDNN